MKKEVDFEYQKCGFCKYFLSWGNYEKDASAAEVQTGKCRRYPPRIDFMFYPYFSKNSRNPMETVAQIEPPNESWIDSETPAKQIVKTCSVQPYVKMDDFCGEYQPAHIEQVKYMIDLFETYDLSTTKLQKGLEYFERLHRAGMTKRFVRPFP